ncbi:tetratricopeptide repeat (TPR)-containing protein isoform X2 [Wolffia australiana]
MRSGVGIQRSFYSSPALGIQPSTTFIGRQFPRTNLRRERRTPRPWQIMASIQKIEIRVCVNRTCNRMGSREILATLSDIAPPAVTVKSCGCLGLCGAGPNLALLPSGTLVRHCATPAKAADVLAEVCGSSREGARKSLEALALRKKAEALLQERGNPSEALALLRQAIDLKPLGGLHLIYKTRSVAKLTLGDAEGALEDANEALKIDPRFHLMHAA